MLSRGLRPCNAQRSVPVCEPLRLSGSGREAGRAARFREERPDCGRCGGWHGSQVGVCSQVRGWGPQAIPAELSHPQLRAPGPRWLHLRTTVCNADHTCLRLGRLCSWGTWHLVQARVRGLSVGPPAALPLDSLEPGFQKLPDRMDLRSSGAREWLVGW